MDSLSCSAMFICSSHSFITLYLRSGLEREGFVMIDLVVGWFISLYSRLCLCLSVPE